MTVTELIDLLKQCPPDAKVRTEGCDCDAHPESVLINQFGEVIIERSPHARSLLPPNSKAERLKPYTPPVYGANISPAFRGLLPGS